MPSIPYCTQSDVEAIYGPSNVAKWADRDNTGDPEAIAAAIALTCLQAATAPAIRDRIRELRRVRAGDLIPHPKNWRTHPQAQQEAMQGILAEIGYADALLVRELPDGSLMLVDGHLRAETTPDSQVPVLVLDVTESEADKILATLDPLAALAEANAEKLDALLRREVNTGSAAVAQMLDDLATVNGLLDEPADEARRRRRKGATEAGAFTSNATTKLSRKSFWKS